jgi:hypothetical protein
MLRDSLVEVYLSKSDDELLSLAADPGSLIEEARPILAEELGRRGLIVAPEPALVENRPPDFWSGAVGKFLGSVGDYLLCFAIAILGSNAILGEINPIVHTHSFSGLAAKMWIAGVTVAALLGFFVTRYRPTRMALWIWILPVILLVYRIVLYATRTNSIFGDSVLQHFVAPNCPESVRDCTDFSFFTLLAARTLAFSLAAWVSLRFQRRPNSAKILET